jgi:hypothetical protein
MNKRFELYESLLQLSFLLIAMFALAVGTFGLLSICRMLINNDIPRTVITAYSG